MSSNISADGMIDRPDQFVRCRTVGHAWQDFVPVGMRRPLFGWRLSLRCTSCATERHDLVNAVGDVLTREYRYPGDYQMRGGAPTRADVRVELARRGSVMRIATGPADRDEEGRAAVYASKDDLWGRGNPNTPGGRARSMIDADADSEDVDILPSITVEGVEHAHDEWVYEEDTELVICNVCGWHIPRSEVSVTS